MRTIQFLPAVMLFGLMACNNAGDKTAATSDSPKAATADTMNMSHMGDSAKMSAAVPEVPAGAKVYFKNLKDGETVTSPVKIEMGVEGLKLDTAGALVVGSGHHHLLIDAGDSIPAGLAVPKDSTHIHFGKAQ